MFCKGLPLVRYLFAILLTRACTLRQLSKAGQRQLGLIRSRHMMHRQSHALDYRGNLAHTVASWIFFPRGRSFDPHYFGDRRHCGRNQTCHWTRSVGDRTAKELRVKVA